MECVRVVLCCLTNVFESIAVLSVSRNRTQIVAKINACIEISVSCAIQIFKMRVKK